MKYRIKLWIALVLGLALSVLGGRATADGFDDYNYREQYGPANVIWMHGLLKDYNDGRITETDLLGELWSERPSQMAALDDFYDGDFSICFQADLVYEESNGVKFTDSNGHLVFYDTSIHLGSNGHVLSGHQTAYNNAVRANSYLNEAHTQNHENCQACPVNNMCCFESVGGGQSHTGCHTTATSTGKRCCNTGQDVPNCTQTQGNPCN